MKKIFWLLFRAFIAYLLTGVLLGLLILNNIGTPLFFTSSSETLGWFSVLGVLVSYVLFRINRTSKIGTLLFAFFLGNVVLSFYAQEFYWLKNTKVHSWTLFLAVLYTILLLYFVFPKKWLRPLLVLGPISAGALAVFWLGYMPLNVTMSVLEVKGTVASDKYVKALAMLPDMYVTCLTSSLFWVTPILVLYTFVRFAHDPRSSYLSLTKRINNAQ